jgi:membrane-anchored glycerophosphoryl diester phosphodiesterase (GDPDase)
MAVAIVPGVLLLVADRSVGGGLALAGGIVIAIVAAVLIYVRLAFAAPALLLERLGVGAALSRSWRLVAGSWWRTFGILALGAIIAGAINGLVQLPFSLVGNLVGALAGSADAQSLGDVTSGMQIALVITNVGSVLASTVTAPFTAALTALLYIDLRIRREGLDVALARAAAQEK